MPNPGTITATVGRPKPGPNLQRYYPHVDTLADAHEAIKQLTDHTYELRDDMRAQRDHIERLTAANEQMRQHVETIRRQLQSGVNSQLSGINVLGSPAATGDTLKYNATTGQLEWGP